MIFYWQPHMLFRPQPVGILLEDETEVWNVDERMLIAPIPDQRHHKDGSSVVVTQRANTLDFWTKNPETGEPENLTTSMLFLERVMETLRPTPLVVGKVSGYRVYVSIKFMRFLGRLNPGFGFNAIGHPVSQQPASASGAVLISSQL